MISAQLPGIIVVFPDDEAEAGIDEAMAAAYESGDWLLMHIGEHRFEASRWVEDPAPVEGQSYWRPLTSETVVAEGLHERLPSLRVIEIVEAGDAAVVELSTADHVLLRLMGE